MSLHLSAEGVLEVVDVVIAQVTEQGRVATHGQRVAGIVVTSEDVQQRHAGRRDASDEEVPVLIVLDIISPPMSMAWCESAGDD